MIGVIMAILKTKKAREMNEKEIAEKLRELNLELSKERAASEIGTVKNPGRIRELRKTIARIKTIINERAKQKEKIRRGV